MTSATTATFDIRPGAATKVIVETAADGTGTTVAAQSLAIGSTLTAWAISRDANNNYVGNVAPDSWSLMGNTGGVADADFLRARVSPSFPFPATHRRSRYGRPRRPALVRRDEFDSCVFFGNIYPDGFVSEYFSQYCGLGGSSPWASRRRTARSS